MGSVDNENTSILLLLVIWHKESRNGLRFIDRQTTLGVEIWGRGAVFEFGVWTVMFPKLRDNLGDGSKMG